MDLKPFLPIALVGLLFGCATKKYTYEGITDGVEVAYRWAHPAGKPSELLVRLRNTTAEDKQMALTLDLYLKGRTVETFEADTCIRGLQTLNGKLNGFFFIPKELTTEQIKSGEGTVEPTRISVSPGNCR